MVKLLVLVYVNQCITGQRSALIKHQAHITPPKLPFLLKRHRNVLQNTFWGETLNLTVLDSGCAKTVCGEEWLKCYIDS